jgi:hypothetical protein
MMHVVPLAGEDGVVDAADELDEVDEVQPEDPTGTPTSLSELEISPSTTQTRAAGRELERSKCDMTSCLEPRLKRYASN